jgi:hypothetical protein
VRVTVAPYTIWHAYAGIERRRIQLIRNPALEGRRWLVHSGRFNHMKKPVSIVQEAGWLSGPALTLRKSSHIRGFDLRTVQLVASRYTNYAIPVAM